jgi:Ca2+-binding RTX toxin-like protein
MHRAVRAHLRVMALGGILALIGGPGVARAGAQPADPCTKSDSVVHIDWEVILTAAAVEFGMDPTGNFYLDYDGTRDPCNGARNENSAFVFVDGTAGANRFNLATQGLGTHLHYVLDLKDGADSIYMLGTPGPDNLHFATLTTDAGQFQTFTYNKDRSPMGELINIERAGATAFGGRDLAWGGFEESYAPSSATTGGGTGPANIPLLMKGGSGKDSVVGGKAGDTLVGGSGNDKLEGEQGKDKLNGGDGTDTCEGGPGKDKIRGCEKD